uniref:Sema domain, transmembrane domain (TM), and cytoplasmic domain, (semaphorin) 6Bb n=1 Tax=Astyanax mexicanus TaxID=7994 RepID=A0A3B1JWL6_ASTMX
MPPPNECRNYIKVLLSRQGGLFICGTNAFNPLCANYTGDTLEMVGETVSGMARCPYDPKHANVALFAEGNLFTATVTDFLAIDAVIYRSLGDSPVVVSRVARVCKSDMGGSQRVLEKQWTSFLKARLNCSIPGDSHFYFNLLHSTSPILHLHGRDIILAVFSTPSNRETHVRRTQHPCSHGKRHSFFDSVVPSSAPPPKKAPPLRNAYQLNKMVVDTNAGPHGNRTVLFLGSSRGTILKFLVVPNQDNTAPNNNVFLEELEGYNPEKCGQDTPQARQLLSLTLDSNSHTLLLAFPSCVVRIPVARCQLYSRCMKNCISSRDPYCGWTRGSTCSFLRAGTRLPFEQDVDHGNTSYLGDCDGLLQESYIEEPDGLVSVNLLVLSAVSAFSTGAALSGLMVCWIMTVKHRQRSRGGGSGPGGRRKCEKEQNMLGHRRSGSVISVTRISERPHSQVENLFTNGWPKSGEMDPGLPTPEQTPLQQKRPTPNVHLPDSDWDQSQTFITQTGPANTAVLYLSSDYLQGSNGEQSGRPSAPVTRNSAGDYRPATPQESPDRRRVVSAPTTQSDYGEPPRWSHNGFNYNSNNGTPTGHHHHHPYPVQPRTNASLVRPSLHSNRGHNEMQDYSHYNLGKTSSERTANGQ